MNPSSTLHSTLRTTRKKLAAVYNSRAVLEGIRERTNYFPVLAQPRDYFDRVSRTCDLEGFEQILASGAECEDVAQLAVSSWRMQTGNRTSAVSFAEVAVRLDHDCFEYKITRASTYMHLGCYEHALQLLLCSMTQASSSHERSRGLANCAAAAERLGDLQAARWFSRRSVDESQVARLAVYNYERLHLDSARAARLRRSGHGTV